MFDSWNVEKFISWLYIKTTSKEFCYGKKFFANDNQGALRKNRDFVARGRYGERAGGGKKIK